MLLRASTLALAAGLAFGAPAVAAADTAPVAAEHVSVPMSKPAPAPASDAARYADREQQDQKAANYEGGSVVIVGISGGAILVLLLLLLILA